jgi:membrane protease YdiL (CAAX protease family)
VFRYKEFSNEVLWQNDVTANYQILLMLIGLVVIPAFVEEFLFRGVILSNLLPYGKGTAILGSALLFGLMHRNVEQLLYATAAGAVLGWIFVQTRSLWPCIMMHFLNNFRSVLQTVLLSRVPSVTTEMALYSLQGVLLALGILCGVRLFCARTECEIAPCEGERDETISPWHRVRLFFNLPMIIFVAWCVADMLILILAALGILR